MSNQEEELPFSEQRQNAFFGHVISNKTYYHQVKSKVQKKWFRDPWVGEAYGLYLDWSSKYDKNNEKLPSVEEILSSEKFMRMEVATRNKVTGAISLASASKATFDWDSIVSELTAWLKCRIYLENVTKSTELFGSKKFNEAFGLLEQSVKQYQEVKFFPDDEVDFLDWRNHFDKTVTERQNALTTGLDILDKQIDPVCVKGCLLPGDTTVIMAPVNVGKTTTMVTIAVANIFQGKDVLFVTHEGRPEDITDKFWSCVTGKQKGELLKTYKTDEQLFSGTSYFLNKHLTYMPINNPDQMIVENVCRIIETKQQDKIAKTGKGYDLLVVDYPAKLGTETSNRIQMAHRQVEHYVYNYFVQLALKHKFHALLAIQTNREASKNNKHQGEHGTQNRLITSEDVSEAWGPIMVATNIISVNRNDDYGDKVIFHVCKSRSSETGISVLAKSDYSRARTHSNQLGGLWYKGNTSVASITTELLDQYINQRLPTEEVYRLEESKTKK
jgi:KaiC/GvpD/RAD55 family RecA-like ATPase